MENEIESEFIHSVITLSQFRKTLYDRMEVERCGMETMVGHNTFRFHLQSIIIKKK